MIYTVIDVMGAAVFALPLTWAFLVFCKKGRFKDFCLTELFSLYLCAMFNVVGIPGLQYISWYPAVNLVPFSEELSRRFFLQLALNALMFAPFGFFLPVLWSKCRSWKITALAGFLTSALIEFLQLFSFRATDVDDLIMNTLGAFLGYLLAWCCFHRRWQRAGEEAPGRVGDGVSLLICVLIPLLSMILLRDQVCQWVYNLPVFR